MAVEARTSGLTFFLDRGLGSRIVPNTLREAGWVLETMDERYGKDESQRIADTQWIEEATIRGDILLCKDLAITHNLVEARVIYMSGARIFALAKADVVGREMADLFLGNEFRIINAVRRVTEPFVFAVSHNGLRRTRVRYPVTGTDL
ncbi:hypothetical protein SAMN05216275_12793 [Streptosporangium canum]|uniref:VapC45 PIN like domain-containing protein n=1 Tax=Streptosporangium canum TaxID=324952 RepID=A0A1I4A7Y0_9ACTN|nr:hypothetical protein [Streptosporangium canum]SFK52433.1 hypothetical protein SAMN05216275_12793 [Streptosporangium canum]